MRERVKVACVQAEPVMLDREATLDRLAALAAEAARNGALLAVFPEAYVPGYPSSRWTRHLAGDDERAKRAFARLAAESVEVPGPAAMRMGEIARAAGIWLAIGVDERAGGTLYNALLLFDPDGSLALHRRTLVPTNAERMVWGQGNLPGLVTVPTELGRIGGLICWENLMPLARFALYEAGVELYLAPTADDSEDWHDSLRHIARESRAFVISPCVFQRVSSYPDDVPVCDGSDLTGRGGSAILGPGGAYLAGPLWDEEAILYADLDPADLDEHRQRFDPSGHCNRPDVLRLVVSDPAAGRWHESALREHGA